jgi:hypothetical protein
MAEEGIENTRRVEADEGLAVWCLRAAGVRLPLAPVPWLGDGGEEGEGGSDGDGRESPSHGGSPTPLWETAVCQALAGENARAVAALRRARLCSCDALGGGGARGGRRRGAPGSPAPPPPAAYVSGRALGCSAPALLAHAALAAYVSVAFLAFVLFSLGKGETAAAMVLLAAAFAAALSAACLQPAAAALGVAGSEWLRPRAPRLHAALCASGNAFLPVEYPGAVGARGGGGGGGGGGGEDSEGEDEEGDAEAEEAEAEDFSGGAGGGAPALATLGVLTGRLTSVTLAGALGAAARLPGEAALLLHGDARGAHALAAAATRPHSLQRQAALFQVYLVLRLGGWAAAAGVLARLAAAAAAEAAEAQLQQHLAQQQRLFAASSAAAAAAAMSAAPAPAAPAAAPAPTTALGLAGERERGGAQRGAAGAGAGAGGSASDDGAPAEEGGEEGGAAQAAPAPAPAPSQPLRRPQPAPPSALTGARGPVQGLQLQGLGPQGARRGGGGGSPPAVGAGAGAARSSGAKNRLAGGGRNVLAGAVSQVQSSLY